MTEPTNAAEVVASDVDLICATAASELAEIAGSRLLLTGGGGFLGYYFLQTAIHWNETSGNEPIEIEVWDNWARGVPAWLSDHEDHAHLTTRTVDITEPVPNNVGHFDWIVHAAGIASPTFYRQHPIATMDVNVNGLRNLLEYARRELDADQPMRGFLYLSTSEIYGDPTPDYIPTPETYRGNVSCTGPRACYDESKRYGETLCVNFAAVHSLPIRVVRPFNNYGPGLKITDRRVIPDFAGDILAGRDIVLLSAGTPTRTFCYVADAVTGYYKALVSGRDGEAYNIGSEAPEISMADLAHRMAVAAKELFGYEGSVRYETSEDDAYLTDNPNRRCPVIAKARGELGYEPLVDLDDGLRRSIIWYRENEQAEVG